MRQKGPTMADIAKLSGVSQSTVSLVLNQKGGSAIPPETVERVQAAARKLHYVKAPRSRTAPEKTSRSVLALATDMTNPYYAVMLHELDLAAASAGLELVCCNTYHQPDRETRCLEMALSCRYFAAVFLYPPDAPAAVSRISRQMPVIAICDKNAAPAIDLIELNNRQSGRIAAEHLLSLGHRRIAVLSSDPARNAARSNRILGIRSQMEEHGAAGGLSLLVPTPEELAAFPGSSAGYRTGFALGQRAELLSGGYTALIAINDMVAMGAIDALSARGAQFPQDYSIVGFDNLLYAGLSRISLTTVDHHIDLLAQAAVTLLARHTDAALDPALLASARFKVECMPQLVVRSSTAPLA